MSEILLYYRRPDPTTWVYLSSFLTIGLFFVFHRFWSIRNLDIALLIMLSPGLLMVYEGRRRQLVHSETVQSEMTSQQNDASDATMRPDPSDPDPSDPVPSDPVPRDSGVIRSIEGDSSSTQDDSDGVVRSSFLEMSKAVGGSLVGFVSQAIDGQDESVTRIKDASSDDALNGSAVRIAQLSVESTDQGEPLGVNGVGADLKTGADQTGVNSLPAADASYRGSQMNEPESALGRTLRGPSDPRELQRWGFIYLFVIESLLLIRLMIDPLMVRRPLLDPNLTTGGLYFIGISLFIFMMANVVTSSPRVQVEQGPELGPGYAMMNLLPAIPTRPITDQLGGAGPPSVSELVPQQIRLAKTAKSLAILAQFLIVVGIVFIGSRHFANVRAGVGCALLYLLLPYTAQMTGRVDHALPAASLLWAILCYRRPLLSGLFLGLAGGLVYYPLFLLPLWISFYWKRGARKFALGVFAMLFLLMIALSFDNTASLTDHLQRMFGLLKPNRDPQEFRGIWALGWNPIWRLPVIVAFAILSAFFAIWPARKNLGTLMSSSAALMVAAQFWHGYGGGLYIAWFMPLLLLVIFRPNLQDRIATKVVVGQYPTIPLQEVEIEPA